MLGFSPFAPESERTLSLKAKIEAVIYASEEPVTLAQLAGLLGHEAQAELDRLDERQGSLPLDPEAEDPAATPPQSEPSTPQDEPADNPEDDLADDPESAPAEAPAAPEDPTGPSAADRKAAREKERRLREFFRSLLDQLIHDYAAGDRGLEVREVAGGFRMATKPEYHDAVRGFVRSLKTVLKLSLQALETLAVVAYKQPVTAPEVSEIRGVDSGGVLGSLLGRKLIATAGRKQVIGRPILYKTTRDFLLRFGLKDVSELPSIEEFEKMAGDLIEQEEIPMPTGSDTTAERITEENLREEQDAVEAQADGDSNGLDGSESNLPASSLPAVDGRISALDPTYNQPGDDPSADEAAIQQDQAAGE